MERDSNNINVRLQELGGSDFEIVDNQPNIKGWTVKTPQGETIGEVEELIFDVQSRKVRYMVVDLEGSALDLESRDVLVPIGLAELHESDDDVILPNVTVEHFRALPNYTKGRIGRDVEDSITSIFGGIGAALGAAGAAITGAAHQAGNALEKTADKVGDAFTNSNDDDYYNQSQFDDRNLTRNRPATVTDGETRIPIIEENLEIGKREVETGGARITSRIVENQVEENITLREEHVQVERNPVNRPVTDSDITNFREGEIELTEHAEVPIVAKDARVVEEITLGKEVTERDEVISDTVRKTEVDIERLDSDKSSRTDTDTYLSDEDRRRT